MAKILFWVGFSLEVLVLALYLVEYVLTESMLRSLSTTVLGQLVDFKEKAFMDCQSIVFLLFVAAAVVKYIF
jgi:hypothetical protein